MKAHTGVKKEVDVCIRSTCLENRNLMVCVYTCVCVFVERERDRQTDRKTDRKKEKETERGVVFLCKELVSQPS